MTNAPINPINPINTDRQLDAMARSLQSYCDQQIMANPVMIGIHTGGVWVAKRLHKLLNVDEPLATLDISFYRDDFSQIGINPRVKPSSLPLTIDNRHIILIDDVLYTGRTIRAALNEIFDYGRPASVTLAVLVERDGRELPIQADIVGEHIELLPHQHIKLTSEQSLELNIVTVTNDSTD